MIIDNTVVVQETTNVDVQEDSAVGNILHVFSYVCINLKNNCNFIETALVPSPIPTCSLEENRVISLILLWQFIKTITEHSA